MIKGAKADVLLPSAGPAGTVMVLCPTHRDHRELARLVRPGTTYLFHDYAGPSLEDLIGGHASAHDLAADPFAEVERILAWIRGAKIDAVISTDDYPGSAPWAFVGGTIHKVVVDVSGEPFVDLEKEMAAAFARD